MTLVYEVPGIVLTIRGKAHRSAAPVGDIVNVLNVQSKRTVQATVTGPGRVTVAAARPRRRGRQPPPTADQTHRHRPVSVNHHAFASRLRPQSSALHRLARSAAARRSTAWRSIGEQPPLTAIENPTAQPGYKPVQMPMPTPQPASYNPNSLWRNGSRAFFKDQRAHQVGDILTVKVKITDKAKIENETQRSRENKEDSGVDNFFGKRSCRS